jgi:hypothetical protein
MHSRALADAMLYAVAAWSGTRWWQMMDADRMPVMDAYVQQ